MFHIQTPNTFVNQKGRPRQQAANKRVEHASLVARGHQPEPWRHTKANNLRSDEVLHSKYELTLNPSREIIESWDLHIVPLLVNQFSFPTAHGGRTNGSLECLPILLGNAKSDSTLSLVAHAVGYVYLANRTNSRESAIVHKSLYGRTLRSLRADLSQPSCQREDSTLLAVWLSCLYEVSVPLHPKPSQLSHFKSAHAWRLRFLRGARELGHSQQGPWAPITNKRLPAVQYIYRLSTISHCLSFYCSFAVMTPPSRLR